MRAIIGSMLLAALVSNCGERSPQPPRPESIEPASGIQGEATPITIRGENFFPRIKISYTDSSRSTLDTSFTARLGDFALVDVGYSDGQTLTAVVPDSLPAGSYELTVEDPEGRSGTLVEAFTVLAGECPRDADSDGHIDALCSGGDDCDDNDNAVYPGADDDTCDGVDNDCDESTDEDYVPAATSCGAGVCASTGQVLCQAGSEVDNCTPADPPEDPEASCDDGLDNDCDGFTDGGDPDCGATCVDQDGDGYGNPGDTSCPNGAEQDCDDDPAACGADCFPGNPELCDGFDNNCDGSIDENLVSADWYDAAWLSRRTLTFDNGSQGDDLSAFPVLVILEDAWFDYAKCKADGTDLRFVDAEGLTELAYHIESWDPTGRSFIWVRVPLIAAGSTGDFIWMYYGNPAATDVQDATGTYDADFVGVWHLNESPADEQTGATHLDATGHGHDGTQHNNAGAPAQIGGGQEFDGDDYIRIPHAGSLNISNAWTMEAWMRADIFTEFWQAIISKDCDVETEDNRAASLWLNQNRAEVWYTPGGNPLQGNQQLQAGIWYYLAATYDGTRLSLYVDGARDRFSNVAPPDTNSYDLFLGQRGENTEDHWWFTGALDEVRISRASRSGDWLQAQHQVMTGNFVTFGQEEGSCP